MKVCVAYPAVWDTRTPQEVARDTATLAGLAPGIEVVFETYENNDALRTLRGRPPYDEARRQAPELTAAQRAAFADAEVILTLDLPFDIDIVAPKLRWVQAIGAGVGQLQSAGLERTGVLLTSGAGIASAPIAEFVMARILAHWKRFSEFDALQRERRWTPLFGRNLDGSTLGIVGFGAIGSAIADRAKAWGMRVMATRRHPPSGAPDPRIEQFFAFSEIPALVSQCDAVVLAAPETPETFHLFSAAVFAAMKKGTYFCNVARGSLVDQGALRAALQSGHLAAAAIDVATPEPLPPDDPLWDAPNLFVSPHSAASVERYFHLVWQLFNTNMQRFLKGESLKNLCSPSFSG